MIPSLSFNSVCVQTIKPNIDVLRLDLLHPIISGNKWFKLDCSLKDAIGRGFATLATFGGAYSNHIVATAGACNELGINSIGIIRGEEPKEWSATLKQAQSLGMKLVFVSRAAFRDEEGIKADFPNTQKIYWVSTGGYSRLGAEGVMGMYRWIPEHYTHICCAVGTGTVMAGLIMGANAGQRVIGIDVLKNNLSTEGNLRKILTEEEAAKDWELITGYHFGGFAKHPPELMAFIEELMEEKLPTDIVYTSKLIFAIKDLQKKGYFPNNSKIIAIHGGGLQGNPVGLQLK